MKTLEPAQAERDREHQEYWPVEYQDGHITCSCGRELRQVDEDTYVCTGGYPMYRLSKEEIIKDKYGGLWVKTKDHRKPKGSEQ